MSGSSTGVRHWSSRRNFRNPRLVEQLTPKKIAKTVPREQDIAKALTPGSNVVAQRPTAGPNPNNPVRSRVGVPSVGGVYQLRMEQPQPKPGPSPTRSLPWVARAIVEQRGNKYYLVGYVLADGDNRSGVYYRQPEVRGHGPNANSLLGLNYYQPAGNFASAPEVRGRFFKFDVPAQEIGGASTPAQAIAAAQRNLDNGTWSADTVIRAVTGKSAAEMSQVERVAFVLSLAVSKGTGEGATSVYAQFTTPEGLAEVGGLLALIASPVGVAVELALMGELLLSLGKDAAKLIVGMGAATTASNGSDLLGAANLATDLLATVSSTLLSGLVLKPLMNGARGARKTLWSKGDTVAPVPNSPAAALEYANRLLGGKGDVIGVLGQNNIVPFFRRGNDGGGVTPGGGRGAGGVSALMGQGPARIATMSVGQLQSSRGGSGLSGGEALTQLNAQLATSPQLLAQLPELKRGQGFTTLVSDGGGGYFTATVTGAPGGGAVMLTLDDWHKSGVIGNNAPTVRVGLSGSAGSPLDLSRLGAREYLPEPNLQPQTRLQPLPIRVDVADLGKTPAGKKMSQALAAAQQNPQTLDKLSAGQSVVFGDGGKVEPVASGNVKFSLPTGEYYVVPYDWVTQQFALPASVRKLVPTSSGSNVSGLASEQLRQPEAAANAAHQERLNEIRRQNEEATRQQNAEYEQYQQLQRERQHRLEEGIRNLHDEVRDLGSDVTRTQQRAAESLERTQRLQKVGNAYFEEIKSFRSQVDAWNSGVKQYDTQMVLLNRLQSKLAGDLGLAEMGTPVNLVDLRAQINRIKREYGSPQSPSSAQTAYARRNKLSGAAESMQSTANKMAAMRRADMQRGDNFLTDYHAVTERGAQKTRSILGMIDQALDAGLERSKELENRVRALENRVLSVFNATGEAYQGKLAAPVLVELSKKIEANATTSGASIEQELARLRANPDEAALLLGDAIAKARGAANGFSPQQIEVLRAGIGKDIAGWPASETLPGNRSVRLKWVSRLMSSEAGDYGVWQQTLVRHGLREPATSAQGNPQVPSASDWTRETKPGKAWERLREQHPDVADTIEQAVRADPGVVTREGVMARMRGGATVLEAIAQMRDGGLAIGGQPPRGNNNRPTTTGSSDGSDPMSGIQSYQALGSPRALKVTANGLEFNLDAMTPLERSTFERFKGDLSNEEANRALNAFVHGDAYAVFEVAPKLTLDRIGDLVTLTYGLNARTTWHELQHFFGKVGSRYGGGYDVSVSGEAQGRLLILLELMGAKEKRAVYDEIAVTRNQNGRLVVAVDDATVCEIDRRFEDIYSVRDAGFFRQFQEIGGVGLNSAMLFAKRVRTGLSIGESEARAEAFVNNLEAQGLLPRNPKNDAFRVKLRSEYVLFDKSLKRLGSGEKSRTARDQIEENFFNDTLNGLAKEATSRFMTIPKATLREQYLRGIALSGSMTELQGFETPSKIVFNTHWLAPIRAQDAPNALRDILDVTDQLRSRLGWGDALPSGLRNAQPSLAPYRVVIVDSSDGGIIASDVIQAQIESKLGRPVQVVVVGDHRNAPYGNKSPNELPNTVNNLLRVAQELNPDVVFIACNTACTQLPMGAGKGVQVPLVDIVTMTSEYIANNGGASPAIFATRATVDSGAYGRTVSSINPNVKVNEVATPELATLVNEGANIDPSRDAEVRAAVSKYVARLPQGTTSVWLCCTHYPALEGYIRDALDARGMQSTRVIDPMSRVASQVGDNLLARQNRGEAGNGVAGVPLVVLSSGRSATSGAPATDVVDVKQSVERYNGRDARILYTTDFSDPHLNLVRQAIATPDNVPSPSTNQRRAPRSSSGAPSADGIPGDTEGPTRQKNTSENLQKNRFNGRNIRTDFVDYQQNQSDPERPLERLVPASKTERIFANSTVTVQQVVELVGGLNDSQIKIQRIGTNNVVVKVQSRGFFELEFSFSVNANSITSISLRAMYADASQPLIGQVLALKMMRQAERLGAASIDLFANQLDVETAARFGETPAQGHRVWPRLGYDGAISSDRAVESVRNFLSSNPAVANRLNIKPTDVNKSTRILDLLYDRDLDLVPEMDRHWRRNGASFFGRVEFRETNSRSYRVFQKAVREFAIP